MNDAPLETIKVGPGYDYIQAAIWENTSQKGQIYHSIKLSRQYRDDQGWHETQTMFTHHLPLTRLANDKAYDLIHTRLAEIRHEKEQAGEQKSEESAQSAPAKKRGQKKTHVEKIEEERSAKAKGK